MTLILGYSSEDLRICVGFTMHYDSFYLCFENDIHSTIQLFAEYCKLSVLFVVWCYNTSTHKSNVFVILCEI